MTITDKEIEQLRMFVDSAHEKQNAVIAALFNEHITGDHHRFLEAWIAKEDRNTELWERLKGNLIFWLLTGITGAIGIWIWKHFQSGNF